MRSPKRKLHLEKLEEKLPLAYDFGDAPLPFPVTLADDGARHLLAGADEWTQLGETIYGVQADEYSGHSVSLNADGRVLAVGGPAYSGENNFEGQTRIYRHIAETGNWDQIGVIGGTALLDFSGYSVSLSDDGKTVAVGEPLHHGAGGTQSGQVRVFHYVSDGVWDQTGGDIEGKIEGSISGSIVSLSGDGKTMVLGGDGTYSAVYRYVEDTGWTQLGEDFLGKSGENLGYSVSLNDDGNVVAFGSPAATDSDILSHAVIYRYHQATNSWVQLGERILEEHPGDRFGFSVALSADGKTVASSSMFNDDAGTDAGHVRVFHFDETADTWIQHGTDIEAEAGDQSGYSVALSDDANIVAISSVLRDSSRGRTSVYHFNPETGNWFLFAEHVDGDRVQDFFGRCIALSDDGLTVATGAYQNDGSDGTLEDSGQAKVFSALVATTLSLGEQIDSELDGKNSENADADGSDEDGVTFDGINLGDLTSKVTVNVQNAVGAANLNAWLDFDGDGNWSGPGEQIFTNQVVVNGDNELVFDVPAETTAGRRFARFRLNTAGDLGIGGRALDGEVEDSWVWIAGPPTLDPVSDVTIDEDAVEQTIGLAGISDGDVGEQPLSVTATSSNTGLIVDPIVDYTSPEETGTLRFTPLADQSGSSTITVTVEDGGLDNDLSTPADNATFNRTFEVTVNPVNDVPTLDPIADVTIDEDAPEQAIDLSGIFAGGGESQLLSVIASSSNTGLIVDPIVDYTSPEETGILRFTPLADQSGTSTITVTVEDGGLDDDLSTKEDNATFSQSCEVTVKAVNDVPSFVMPLELDFDESVAGFQFDLRDISPGPHEDQPLQFGISTDNGAFLSDFSVDYSGGSTGIVTFSTTPGELGRGNLIVRLEDGGLDGDLETTEDNATTTHAVDVMVTAKKRTYALTDQTIFGEIEGTYRDTYWKNSYSQSIQETLFRAYKRSRLEHRWEFDMAGADVSMEFFVYASHDATNEQFRFQYQVEGGDKWKTLVTTTQNEGKQYYARVVDPDLATDGKVTLRVADTLRNDEDERATVTVERIFFLSRRLTNMDDAVNVLVFDPEGAEGGGNKGQFRFQLADRNRLDHDVEVFYELSGTAQNSDYREFLRGSKVIKAGNLMTRLFVTPKSDKLFEGAESVTVRILDDAAYRLTGDPEATVMIHDQQRVTSEAFGEVTLYGTHDLNYPQGYYLDDQWERVTEEIYAGGNRTRMDHRWKFDLAGESEMIFRGRFEITSHADQDDFQVVYSADGNSWKTLGRLKPDAGIVDLEKAVTLPEDVGEVWVRMFDRYRKNGDTQPSTVAIDHLCFERVESSAMPPVMFFPPALAMMPGAAQVRRPVDAELFELLGQGEDRLLEWLGEQDPGERKSELESFYRQWQERDDHGVALVDWMENRMEPEIDGK